jgi:phenylalanyl-tRNA synthetase beta chain
MLVSESWLREFVKLDIDRETLLHQLTMAGLEVDGTEPAAADFSNVVVGEVVGLSQHPDADRLRVCEVSVGEPDLLQIVCGAPNVEPGMKVPTACVGAVLPGNFKIKSFKLRGVQSSGMLCSQKELGLAESSEGLMSLPASAVAGTNIREYLELDDEIIEVDLTPNRADCLSMEGVAREVAIINQIEWHPAETKANAVEHDRQLPLYIRSPEACPRYLGRLITGIDPTAETPIWMQERLRRSGFRSLGPLVDVTNYVLMEMGQPLHAFDADKIDHGIVVRFAKQGEKVLLLNDEEVELVADTLVIADESRALALAGIMGGREAAVCDQTRNIFLECAFFSPAVIMGKARQYGLHTDSSHRFERGVDPELQMRAIERASELIVSIAGGQCGPVSESSNDAYIPNRPVIRLRPSRVEKILGVSIDRSEMSSILERLGMSVSVRDEETWQVQAPSFRFDIAIEADLIEEIGRVIGYDNIPLNDISMHSVLAKSSEARVASDLLKETLVGRGYREVITYSFVDPDRLKQVDPGNEPIVLKNPISSDLAVMRTSLWCGLLETAERNLNRQQSRIRIFESGLKFLKTADGIEQKKYLAGLVLGTVSDNQWGENARSVDFFDAKGDVEALLQFTGRPFQFVAKQHPALHPGQAAEVLEINGEHVGWIGVLHPELERQLGFNSHVVLYELDEEILCKGSISKFNPISKFPHVRRDLAVSIGDEIPSASIVESIRREDKWLVTDVKIFDVYRGPGVESGRKSVAMSLVFQDSSRTLQDFEIDSLVSRILKKLETEFDAKLRD